MRDCERKEGRREQCGADHGATANAGRPETRAGGLKAAGGVFTGKSCY